MVPLYDDEVGWVRVDGLITAEAAARIAVACERVADELIDPRSGDKPHGLTRRLTAMDERVPETLEVVDALGTIVDQVLPRGWHVTEIGYRCPGPGTGTQQLHADDRPRLDPAVPTAGATVIVALVDFTADNGATRVVPGSHRRVDQQRLSQNVEHLPGEQYLLGPAGTGFVFHRHLLHAGSANRSTTPRPGLQISFAAGR